MAEILLVGADAARASELRSLLRHDGHDVAVLRGPRDWREVERELLPDLIVAAIDSPREVLALGGERPRGFPAPILVVQHEPELYRGFHFDERLVDQLTSPFMREDLLGRVDALVRVKRLVQRTPGTADPTVAAARRRLQGGLFGRIRRRLRGAMRAADRPVPRSHTPYLEVAARLAEWADRRDAFEPGHAERVTGLCAMIAEALHVDDEDVAALLRAAMLHDLGKVFLPVEVLRRKEPLEEGQLRLIRTHPRRGATLLKALDHDRIVAETILYHHERPDGRGYYGLPGGEVPRPARILAVAEVYDAMTRSLLREPLSSREALTRMEAQKGRRLDADCVEALVDKLKPRPNVLPLSSRGPR